MLDYRCPKCNSIMYCVSTASIPPITRYDCYSCGYSSKPVKEDRITTVLPKEYQEELDPADSENKVRLIDANELKEHISELLLVYSGKEILDAIDNAPTVEQKDWKFYFDHGYAQAKREFERPQGEWVFVSRHCWKCPYCQELTNEGKNFCPNCGARMIKEVKNDTN